MSANEEIGENKLPATIANAEPVARLASGIATALAAMYFPAAALAQPFIDRLITQYVKRTENILLQRLNAGGVTTLTDEQTLQFVPMANRLIQAGVQGEYEHNLRLLSEYITNELKQTAPNAGNFLRISRQLEGLSQQELLIIALSDKAFNEIDAARKNDNKQLADSFIDATYLVQRHGSRHALTWQQVAEALNSLSARGLLIPDGASRMDKSEEYYRSSATFNELVNRARGLVREPLDEAAST